MRVPFRKMHGAGNDFVVVDDRFRTLDLNPARITALADRHTGIGCDQFITLEPAQAGGDADVFMRIHNPDGSEAGACGNATRCIAALLHAETGRSAMRIQTISGVLPATVSAGRITVDMGVPKLRWDEIPLAQPCGTLHLPIEGVPAACNMGNPHATLFVADIDAVPITTLGPALEHHKIFPERANIGFAQILAPDRIRLRVWERGAGLTRACGSGACAALVNAVRRGLSGTSAELVLDGGTLWIDWQEGAGVLMTGPAVLSFEGTVELNDFECKPQS